MKNILKTIIYSGVLSVVVFAQPAFAVTFSTIKTNSALGTNSDSTLGAPGASVADFFAAQNAYEANEADKKIPTISDYTPEKSNSDSSSGNSVGSLFGSDDTSNNSDSQANGNSENSSATNSDDESSWEDRGASEDSASAQAGSYGTIVGSTYGNSLQGSAFYARSGNSNNALNSGYFFIPLLMLLAVIYLVRRMFQKKATMKKYQRVPRYIAADSYRYQAQYTSNF